MHDFSRRLGIVLRAGFVIAVVTMAVVLWSVELDGFLLLTVVGGIVLSAAFWCTNRLSRASKNVPDQFARDAFSTDTLNFAHVRVAGVGGVGLVLVAVAMALDFALVGAVLVAGLSGGVLAAAAVILYRRRNGPLSSSSTGPGARSMLMSESRVPSDKPRVEQVPPRQRHTAVASA